MGECAFTVFTPTYNRAHTLNRVFESLQRQTCRDFEWLIVDDGSGDHTHSLVEEWQRQAHFPIRYLYQENGGKHRAFNRGVRSAAGRLFLTLDSDDACTPNALERFLYHWQAIPEGRRREYSGVSALCMDREEKIIGTPFPVAVMDSNSIEMRGVLGGKGEKWGFCRTDILLRHPYPEIEGEKYIAPSYVWNQIARRYLTRYVNEALRIYALEPDSLTVTHARLRARNPRGSALYYNAFLTHRLTLKQQVRAAVNYVRFSLHGKESFAALLTHANAKLPVIFSLPFGTVLFWRDRRSGFGLAPFPRGGKIPPGIKK